ncbi:MAG: hypothetical protein HY985_08600 [Magnetospirillum sp.]|nr:hypothetical protein [Magnetospirillum sp.]
MSQVYEALIPPYRAIVDRLIHETEGEDWEVRRAYLASVYATLANRQGRVVVVIDPETDLSGIIAAVIERAGEPSIAGRLQAGIYAASAKPEHRQASQAWFDDHPAEYERITVELTAGNGTRRLN